MYNVLTVKVSILSMLGILGGSMAAYFGGWTAAHTALVLFMLVDYVSGLIVAGVFRNSPKTPTGCLSSKECFTGLCKKGMILLMVIIGASLDNVMGTRYVQYGVIYSFLVNEGLSILENCGLMGLPIPAALTNAIDIFKGKVSGK